MHTAVAVNAPLAEDAEQQVALVVESSPRERAVVARILAESVGLRAAFAGDGNEALGLLEQRPFALVLTELAVPGVEGLDLVREIRSRHPDIPVVPIATTGNEETAVEALLAGAASYVPRRSILRDLPHTLSQVLALARVERRRQRFLESIKVLDCHFELENDPTLVPLLVVHLQEHLVRMHFCDQNGKLRLGVALEEALLNGMYHGNLELDSRLRDQEGNAYQQVAEQRSREPPYCDRRLHIYVHLDPEEARFVIRDQGPGFDPASLPDPTDPENLLRASGRGLLLIRTFMDAVRHNERGNEITLIKRATRR